MRDDQLLKAAQTHVARGEWRLATTVLKQLIVRSPNHVDALNLNGIVARQLGNPAEALDSLRRAFEVAGAHPIILINLGATLEDLGEFAEAEHCYQLACSQPEPMAQAYFNLGRLQHQQERYPAAEHSLTSATQIDASDPDSWNTLGTVQNCLGKTAAAMESFKRAISHDRKHVNALINLCGTLLGPYASGSASDQLVGYCLQALEAAPEEPQVWNIKGLIEDRRGETAAAENSFRRALTLAPGFVPALSNLGLFLTVHNRHDEADKLLQQAVLAAPENSSILNNLGVLRLAQWRLIAAESALAGAAKMSSGVPYVSALPNLGAAQTRSGKIAAALGTLARAVAMQPNNPTAFDNLLMATLYADNVPPRVFFQRHREYATFFEGGHRPLYRSPRLAAHDANNNLRVGFVSGDFCRHPVTQFLGHVISELPQYGISTVAYNNTIGVDEVTESLRIAFGNWREIRYLSDQLAAEVIAGDEIDVLVDLSGHTAENRLGIFVRGPAPVQATWLGYPGTTGLSSIDWRLGDSIADPPGSEEWHSENIYRFPNCFLAFAPPANSPDASPNSSLNCITFACFNTLSKISESCRSAWIRILLAVPDARLAIKSKALTDRELRQEFVLWFSERGIDQARLVFPEWLGPQDQHLSQYNQVDISLDSFPYTGTTTTCESLWMGVPVITLAGTLHHERVGASLLGATGLENWVANDIDSYVSLAVHWASHRDELLQVKAGLRERLLRSPLCDGKGFARYLSEALHAIHRATVCAKLSGHAPAVPAVPVCLRKLPENVSIYVPDSLNQITNYVLLEQGDWFEDEIRFLRTLCRSGDNIIDVGANYGVYALSLAKTIGPAGQLVAIEPSPSTASVLRKSVQANGFASVVVVEAAASDQNGSARLNVSGNAELNRLNSGDEGLLVNTLRLDDHYAGTNWTLIKLDAEGHELAVLGGAQEILKTQSPLLMIEACADDRGPNLVPLHWLAELCYSAYRLIGELGILVPVDPRAPWDPYWLNVFACKTDRARELEIGNLLIYGPPAESALLPQSSLTGILAALPALLPYRETLWPTADEATDRHVNAIAHYLLSKDNRSDAATRYSHLDAAWREIQALSTNDPTPYHLSSLARIAAAMGFRDAATRALTQLLDVSQGDLPPAICLPADASYDGHGSDRGFGAWIGGAARERLAQLAYWSSYYRPATDNAQLVDLAREQEANELAARRAKLHSARFFFSFDAID